MFSGTALIIGVVVICMIIIIDLMYSKLNTIIEILKVIRDDIKAIKNKLNERV